MFFRRGEAITPPSLPLIYGLYRLMRPPQEKLYPEDMRARFAAGTLAAVDAARGEIDRTEWVRQAVAEKLARAKVPPSVPEISGSSPPKTALPSPPARAKPVQPLAMMPDRILASMRDGGYA